MSADPTTPISDALREASRLEVVALRAEKEFLRAKLKAHELLQATGVSCLSPAESMTFPHLITQLEQTKANT